MRRARPGFTPVELMTTMVIAGIMAVIAFPKIQTMLDGIGVRSGKQAVASYVAQARATAIHNGRTAQFVRAGNRMRITIDSAGTQVAVGGWQDLYESHKVTLGTTRDTIVFDGRGFAVGLGGPAKILIDRAGKRDSVCIVGLGKITTRGCSL